jgi:transmembrane protein 70
MSFLKLNRVLQHPLKYCSFNFISSSSISSLSFKITKNQKLKPINSLSYSTAPDNNNSNNNSKEWNKYLENENLYGKLVYTSKLRNHLFRAKVLSLSSSVLGIGMLPFLALSLKEASLLANILVFSTTSFFIFATPLLFQYVTRRHVNRLHYNYETDTYTAFLFNFILQEYKIQFKTTDIQVPDMPGMFTSFHLTNLKRSIFIDYDQVTDKSIVARILGFDKPFDYNKYDKKNKQDDDDDD